MNLLDLGCSCLTLPHLKEFMDLAGYPGQGGFAALLGVTIWMYGYIRADRKAKQLGYAIFITLTVVALITVTLKLALQVPRPTPRSGFSFPSGDSATAFGLAAAAGVAYPITAPLFYLLATLTAIARLYFRAHFVWDVIGGALLGSLCGLASMRKLLSARAAVPRSYLWLSAWLPGATLGALALSFFVLLEREISRHKLPVDAPAITGSFASIDFGTRAARAQLIDGWTANSVWPLEGFPFNWVEGLRASVILPVGDAQDGRLLLHAYPYRPRGFVCQRAALTMNGVFIAWMYFEQDWQRYLVSLPKALLRAGANRIDFVFVYADSANWHGMNKERRPLSVAFHKIQLVTATPGASGTGEQVPRT